RPGGHRRQEPGGRGGRASRVPDQARAGVRPGRPPDDQPRLRAAASRARRGQAEAARHGGRRRPGPSRATRRRDSMSTDGGFLFTSESVTEGHPDKVADQISDAIVDAALAADPQSRVAVETLLTTGLVVLAGEITTNAVLDFAAIAREVICDIGYDTGDFGFDGNAVGVITALDRQSPDIGRGVTESHDARNLGSTDPFDAVGAGDQGMMFGYATNETPELMPMPIVLAHKLARRLAQVRRNGLMPYLRPDGKTQVTVRYRDGVPVSVEKVLISTQHADGIDPETQIKPDLWEHVVTHERPGSLYDEA